MRGYGIEGIFPIIIGLMISLGVLVIGFKILKGASEVKLKPEDVKTFQKICSYVGVDISGGYVGSIEKVKVENALDIANAFKLLCDAPSSLKAYNFARLLGINASACAQLAGEPDAPDWCYTDGREKYITGDNENIIAAAEACSGLSRAMEICRETCGTARVFACLKELSETAAKSNDPGWCGGKFVKSINDKCCNGIIGDGCNIEYG